MQRRDHALRRIIDEGMRAARPDAQAQARVLASIVARLQPPGGGGGGGGPGTDGGGLAGGLTAMKLAIAGVAATVAVIGAVVIGGSSRERPITPVRGAVEGARAEQAVTRSIAPTMIPALGRVPSPTDRPAVSSTLTPPVRPRTADASRSTASDDTFAAELALVTEAEAALAAEEHARAFALAGTHATRHPTGQLAPERDAIAAVAACVLGRPDAPARAAAFLAAHPRLAAAARVRARCSADRNGAR